MARKKKKQAFGWRRAALGMVIVAVVGAAIVGVAKYTNKERQQAVATSELTAPKDFRTPTNPLENRTFYLDDSRDITKLAAQYRREGKTAQADLAQRIASQPDAIWLTGPGGSDPKAQRDIQEVTRTSSEAKSQGALPVYQLYAIPRRDACAGYSQGGFPTTADYLAWLDRVLTALQTEAVFIVEADAVAQTIKSSCLNPQQVSERYQLLSAALQRLATNKNVVASYLDAGHSEWFPDPKVLLEPLRKAGVDHARGVSVNISNFVETTAITQWSQQLLAQLGGNRGVIIDTSRSGRGVPPPQVKGDARWCNPVGRGVGPRPTVNVPDAGIDAYFWIKTVGESDGDCFGNPAAGVFMPDAALELSRNASN